MINDNNVDNSIGKYKSKCKWGSYPPCLVRASLELGTHYIVHRPVTHVTPFRRVEHFITISPSRTHVLPDSCDFRLCEGGILWGEQR